MIENVHSIEAFEKDRVNNPRTSFNIFPNFLFLPASISLISIQYFSMQTILVTSALWSKFYSVTVESILLHRERLNLFTISVISAFIYDNANCDVNIDISWSIFISGILFCNFDIRTNKKFLQRSLICTTESLWMLADKTLNSYSKLMHSGDMQKHLKSNSARS